MGIYAMSKKIQKEVNRQVTSESVKNKPKESKVVENSALEVTVGLANVKRWNLLRTSFSCETNQSFATKLLDLAQDYLNRTPCKNKDDKRNHKKGDNESVPNNKRRKNEKRDKKEVSAIEDNVPKNEVESPEQTTSHANDTTSPPGTDQTQTPNLHSKEVISKPVVISEHREEKSKKKKPVVPPKKEKPAEIKKKIDHDIRKAPELELQTESKIEPPKAHETESTSRVAIKIKLCQCCGTQHVQDQCPLNFPNFMIPDSIDFSNWQSKYQNLYTDQTDFIKSERDTDSKTELNKYVFAKVSLPNFLHLIDSNTDHGLGVFAKIDIQEFTQFGPLVGKVVKEVDISEDSNMRDIWEICGETNNVYFNTENLEVSNWMRFLRPAPTRDERNITVVAKENSLYFVSTKIVKSGEELLYWQDSTVATNKKKMEKTSCGGCNMTFAHPLYYRTHCSVFHDIRYSLTIRKYHCKVCGVAVLGKENIMKHAADLHNGQGAYQCQFCKKFFLRLNYLEMHRTYGCSANPHRSRPLCDFCGRKFCQPQKLKVHIKRMHSDFAEVLKEFQCKNCLKILGSRAALQRHLKEVHQKQMDGACSCNRCGKHFQNKSNLKIHMLTHSGIKPFKCVVKSCNAAFTTKQCLQFHYKKVHSFTEELMPKIERSIDYTFEAYSGVEDQDEKIKNCSSSQMDSNSGALDEDSDGDETSIDSKNLDDPPMVDSPTPPAQEEQSPEPNSRASPAMEYNMNTVNTTMKILSKGSKKWIGDQPLQTLKSDLYQIDHRLKDDLPSVQIQVPESQVYDRSKMNTGNLNDFSRHEASNASLLVEAALDSVCSEPNIDIDVSTTPNCTDALVNNLYTLAPTDSLPDVTYSETVCINEPRDINLISPSVNDHISVTDELNDELRHNQNISMDYSGFHQEDFSPGNSPEIHPRTNFVRNYINTLSPQSQSYGQPKNLSPVPVPSPPRYDFGHTITTADHLSSDDSNGMGAQNLSLHSKHDIQLDLSIYKSPYKMDGPSSQNRKDFRIKFDDVDKSKVYSVGMDGGKSYIDDDNTPLDNEQEAINQNDLSNNVQVVDMKDKESNDNERNSKYPDDLSTDMRSKFDIDLDLRLKSYDVETESLRPRGLYESSNDLEFRNKTYDVIDNMENRNKPYDGTMETDFRTDRNFEPLVLNSSELQGLDMSARSFHNYSNINRYHHLYPDVDRVDLRLNYSPPAPSYTHADILRVVSLDLTPPGRHSVDLSLRTHSLHQIANSRLLSEHAIQTTQHRLLDQGRLLSSDLSGRILSDHTTNRILSNNDQLTSNHLLSDQRLLNEDSRIISEQPRLLEQSRLIGDGRILAPTTPNGAVSPIPAFTGYSVSQSPYHPTPLAPRPHVSSPTPTPYHHYSTYY